MDLNDFENQKENFNSTVTNTNILKKYAQSILKGELENKKASEEIIPDETVSRTKTKRRVSFSAKLCQVKHFDESLIDQAYHSKNNNQDATTTSDEKHLNDISNKIEADNDIYSSTHESEPAPKKKNMMTSAFTNANRTLNQTDIFAQSMDFGNNTTLNHFDDDSSILLTNQTMMHATTMNVTQGGNLTMLDDKSASISLEENIGSDLVHSIQMVNLTATHKSLKKELNSSHLTATQKIGLVANRTKLGAESMVVGDETSIAGEMYEDQQPLESDDSKAVEMGSATKKIVKTDVTFDLGANESIINNHTTVKETLNVTITVEKQHQEEHKENKTYEILTTDNTTMQTIDRTQTIDINQTKTIEKTQIIECNQSQLIDRNQTQTIEKSFKISTAGSISLLANESINDTEMLKTLNAQRIMANESSCEMLAEKLKKTTSSNASLYEMNQQQMVDGGLTSMLGDKSISYYVPSNFLSNLNMDLASTRALSSGLQINSSVLLGDTSDMEKFDKCTQFYADAKALKEHLTSQLIKFNDVKQKLKDSFNKRKESATSLDELSKRVRERKERSEKCENRLIEKRNELNMLRMNALKEPEKLKAFIYNDTWLEKCQSEFKAYSTKNQSLEKEYQETNVQYSALKERIESNLIKIKSMQEHQKNSQKLQKFWESVFDQKNIPFNLIAFENDSFTLSFFSNLILLDVRVPNIFNDLSHIQLDVNETNEVSDLLHNRKYLNYPIQHISLRTLVDSSGSINYNLLSNYGAKTMKKNEKVPIYIKYCIDLIIGEIAADRESLTLKKSCKQVKDLSMLINHINLACQNAMHLANDFEYFAEKTQKSTSLKCEFDFQNHILTLNLPSVEDSCFFRLKLKILPGFYYQQPIEYTIEQLDDCYFEPDIKRLGSLIDGHHFENGSLRSYLKRLNFNFS